MRSMVCRAFYPSRSQMRRAETLECQRGPSRGLPSLGWLLNGCKLRWKDRHQGLEVGDLQALGSGAPARLRSGRYLAAGRGDSGVCRQPLLSGDAVGLTWSFGEMGQGAPLLANISVFHRRPLLVQLLPVANNTPHVVYLCLLAALLPPLVRISGLERYCLQDGFIHTSELQAGTS